MMPVLLRAQSSRFRAPPVVADVLAVARESLLGARYQLAHDVVRMLVSHSPRTRRDGPP
jgi:hypothetical protein